MLESLLTWDLLLLPKQRQGVVVILSNMIDIQLVYFNVMYYEQFQ